MRATRRRICSLLACCLCGLCGCSTLDHVFDSGFLGSGPKHQEPRTVREFLDQPRPGFDQ